jgi:hypothetical protein
MRLTSMHLTSLWDQHQPKVVVRAQHRRRRIERRATHGVGDEVDRTEPFGAGLLGNAALAR